mmetsp:Transcript_50342/g.79761  ORF Transcript_50342/g.79761 Transcript_50342/m.79761 type:complete len:392 (+) Transcript_50342:99-1274(+)
MLSCQQVSGHAVGGESANEGGVVQWLLVNDGTVAWPEGTTLRLVGGPVLMEPVVDVPSANPGQTIEINLEVRKITESNVEGSVLEVAYCLVTPCGQPFGEMLTAQVAPPEVKAAPSPVCIVLDGCESGLEVLQGEVKNVQWTLANAGGVDWPADVRCELFYNTPGFEHLPGNVDVPDGVGPGMTVEVNIPIIIPEQEGRFQAMWAVVSPSTPDFGDVLVADFNVGEFPFMEWMIADQNAADSVSDSASEIIVVGNDNQSKPKLSAGHVMHNHMIASDCNISYDDGSNAMVNESIDVVSMGRISGIAAGTTWILEVVLTNDGDVAWPDNTRLSCCAGDGFGCMEFPLGSLMPGEAGLIQMELKMSDSRAGCAWTLTDGGDGCFGPVLVLSTA